MTKPIIEVDNLSKLYRLGLIGSSTFRDALERNWYKLLGKEHCLNRIGHKHLMIDPNDPQAGPEPNTLWALKDVSFSVNKGQVIGVIGKNGSGKSTLLKILSKITEPTSGKAIVRGRVASLLEVGTGFHPELTGRDNIYLNGAILGMRKSEINLKYDSIVEFAEISKFIDTPVKRYSSGMYVRLAFAVAAHLEPEILFIDEVLAVGDAGFQKKCLGKIAEISSGEGRTIIFVSHNMYAIQQLCNVVMLLVKGQVQDMSCNARNVINQYLLGNGIAISNNAEWINAKNEYSDPFFKPLRFYLGNELAEPILMPVSNNSDIWVYVEYEIEQLDPDIKIGYDLFSEEGVLIYESNQTDAVVKKWPRLAKGICVVRSMIPRLWLNEGLYRLALVVSIHNKKWIIKPDDHNIYISLFVKPGLSDSPHLIEKRKALLQPIFSWEVFGE